MTVWQGDNVDFAQIAQIPPKDDYDESDMGWGSGDASEYIEIIDGVETEIVRGPNRPVDELWRDMRRLFENSTALSLDNVGERFINRFCQNIGGTYHDPSLSEYALETQTVYTAFNYFGAWLNSAMTAREGQLDLIVNEILPNQEFRPRWPEKTHQVGGMTILVNDTYSTSFYLLDASIDEVNRTWEVTVGMEIIDHFGLDFEDVIDTQNISFAGVDVGLGFSAWYLLQHMHDFQPFESLIRGKRTMSGTY